jgi:hypothetical protein
MPLNADKPAKEPSKHWSGNSVWRLAQPEEVAPSFVFFASLPIEILALPLASTEKTA